jgi:phage host-nuclease inhibitor protein Gam
MMKCLEKERDESPAVKRRVKGLLKNQFEMIMMQSEMAKEFQAIEAKYAEMAKPLEQKVLSS